jgi:prepilin-type N-terminal cleavage/methylation domain-containing protein/prepilin-type processing-associated H-X9-DG protein
MPGPGARPVKNDNMNTPRRQTRSAALGPNPGPRAFTLIELLMVVSIIALLLTMLVPTLAIGREMSRRTACQSNFRCLGVSMAAYHTENNLYFWPYCVNGAYFWGSPGNPVNPKTSPLLRNCDYNLSYFWCPSLPWGTYKPQDMSGQVNEPTTTYGYNGRYLDGPYFGTKDASGKVMPRKRTLDIKEPAGLFVFADSAMYWTAGGSSMILQNSTLLEPPRINNFANSMPTTHFRHLDQANALFADGHAACVGTEGGRLMAGVKIGFAGTANAPHYEDRQDNSQK